MKKKINIQTDLGSHIETIHNTIRNNRVTELQRINGAALVEGK